jgi:ATP-dependent DNA helicase RecG
MVSLDSKIEAAVGAKSAKALAGAFDLHTVGDLIRYFPRKYAERGQLSDIAGLEIGEHVTVMARVLSFNERRMRTKQGWISEVVITDGSRTMDLTFFNQRQHKRVLKPGISALFAGKVSRFRSKLQLTNPDYQLLDEESDDDAVEKFTGLIPVYPAAATIQSWQIAKCVQQALEMIDEIEDPMPLELRARHGLANYDEAMRNIHNGSDWPTVHAARERL